ncbi:patatin-like phospholipase family protein [Nitrosophilus kaiyonis]|uniref:patatin-like phospholipase family protein n=1 Tax=Nitrosophilus kaiyonis TaxID=2930200 RepID=UPI002491FBDF|nr:patatin-like phospholipase family protein [Nitrosophilus kaiyonis]
MKKISLVLGSGGARGYAHIGAIEEIVKRGYEIVAISGSSMGALIGGLYACGKLDEYKNWVLTLDFLDVIKLLDISFAPSGLIKGDRVFEKLESIIGDILIEELPIDFTAVATDLFKQKEVWFQKGKLIDAIRASIAIPTFFTPKYIDGRVFVDGGIVNPLPIAPVMSEICDLTIAINLNSNKPLLKHIKLSKKEKEEKERAKNFFEELLENAQKKFENIEKEKELNYLSIISRSIDTMQNILSNYKIAGYRPDIIIEIPKDSAMFYEFHRAKELIKLGKELAKEALLDFEKNINPTF